MTTLKMSVRVILSARKIHFGGPYKNYIDNNLAIRLHTDLKRVANLIEVTIIFINL